MIEYIRIAIFFAVGIYLHNRIDTVSAVIFIISLAAVLAVKAIFKHRFAVKIFFPVLSLVFGIVLCQYALCSQTKSLAPYEGHYITALGRISEIPVIKDDGENACYVVDIKKITFTEEKEIDDRILLTAPVGFKYGDSVEFSGFVNSFPEKMNENGFDYKIYYNNRDIFFKLYSENVSKASITLNDYSTYALGLYIKSFISDTLDKYYTGDYNAILKAVLTGNKREFSDEFDNTLTKTGTKRFFYPAYLHVMLLMSVLTLIFGAFGKKKRNIIFVFFLIIYASANFSNAVFLKLSILISVTTFLKMKFGRTYYIDTLGITAIICGIINPLIYFDAGFVISMLSSIMIYYFYDYMYKKLDFIKFKYIRRTLSIGIICVFGLVPVSSYFFNYISPYSILLSLVMLPCVEVIIILSPLLILMLAIFNAAPVIGQAVSCMVFALKYIPIAAEKLHLTGFSITRADLIVMLIYLFAVIAAVKYIKHKKSHARIALFTAAAFLVSFGARELTRLDDIEIAFVNVGQGDGTVISAPYKFNILIDGGGGNAYSDYNPGETLFLDYLENHGITKIDSAFVSHYHQDHVQGIIAAMENIKVRNLFLPNNMEGSEWRTALETAAVQNGVNIHYVSSKTRLTYNNGMMLSIIPPAVKTTALSSDENDTSFVYRIEYGDFSAIFTGDMSSFAEKNLIDAGEIYHTDLLKVAHHGSRSATSKVWADTVSPKYAVISVGENNTYNLPNDETLENLSCADIFRTDRDGDIRFTKDKDGDVTVETLNRRQIWQ